MEKFDICYRIPETDSSLIAQLVPFERPELPWSSDSPIRQNIRVLRIICRLSDSAPGLIAWLTVRQHRNSTNSHWRTGLFLRHHVRAYSSEALVEMRGDSLLIEVRAPSPDMFLNSIRDTVEELICTRWPGLAYELRVPCGITCRGDFLLSALEEFLRRGDTTAQCQYCFLNHELSSLLTGFVPSPSPLIAELTTIGNRIATLQGNLSEVAGVLLRVLNAVDTEIPDCPRLVTISRTATGQRRLRFAEISYRVVLWCEHPDHWHPVTGGEYTVPIPKAWISSLAPYLRFLTKTLKLASLIPGIDGVAHLSDAMSRTITSEIELMGQLVELLPDSDGESEVIESWADGGKLTPAEGHALRGLRSLLLQIDKQRNFGGLSRVTDAAGKFLWVCKSHYREYDPGLPKLP
jgi:hypothetical protein